MTVHDDRRSHRLRRQIAVALAFAALTVSACSDSTGPSDGPPGRHLLSDTDFASWAWHPNSREIVFLTPREVNSGARIEAVAISNGKRRVIVAATPLAISPYHLRIVGTNVYFLVETSSAGASALFRAGLEGSPTPQRMIDPAVPGLVLSPDEKLVAWTEEISTAPFRALVITDIAGGNRRVYALAHAGDRIEWSPTGRTIVLHPGGIFGSGTPFQVLDLQTGLIRTWLAPISDLTIENTRDFQWEGENPLLYVTGSEIVARYSLPSGARTVLRTLPAPASRVGWNASFTTVTVAFNHCLKVGTGPFGGGCLSWQAKIDRLDLLSGSTSTILESTGSFPIGGRLSPDEAALAYTYGSCASGCNGTNGLYVTGTR